MMIFRVNPYSGGLDGGLLHTPSSGVLRGSRARMIDHCRTRRIPQVRVTRVRGSFGTYYVIVHGRDSDDPNLLHVEGVDGDVAHVRHAHASRYYMRRTPTDVMGDLLEADMADYAPATPAHRVAASMHAVMVALWKGRSAHVDLAEVAESFLDTEGLRWAREVHPSSTTIHRYAAALQEITQFPNKQRVAGWELDALINRHLGGLARAHTTRDPFDRLAALAEEEAAYADSMTLAA